MKNTFAHNMTTVRSLKIAQDCQNHKFTRLTNTNLSLLKWKLILGFANEIKVFESRLRR